MIGEFENINDQVKARLDKLEKIRTRDENPYKNGLSPTVSATHLREKYESLDREAFESVQEIYEICGRVMAIRRFGKAGFIQLKDETGLMQVFAQKTSLGEDGFARYKELDVGDFAHVKGKVFKTKTGELSIHADELTLLTKSLRPLPEKFHGLTDVETKYRQRYLDLIMNRESKEAFLTRSKVISAMRQFFLSRNFIEVETPMMHPVAGGAAARPFRTHHNTLDMDLFLRIAPELYLKRLVVGGFEKVFEINRNFRNEGISIQHNPEFTMIEFYQAYATYRELMNFTEELFQFLADEILGSRRLSYQGTEIDLEGHWERMTVEEAVLKYSGYNNSAQLRDSKALFDYCREKRYQSKENEPSGKLLMTIFEEECESKLIQPTFLTQFPTDVSPLARRNEEDPFLTDRFELYIFGREIANGFSELNDPIDQKERFLEQVKAKDAGDEEACDMDEDYITALEYGMPPTAGEGIGVDRLVMLFTDAASIRDVILFPQLRKK